LDFLDIYMPYQRRHKLAGVDALTDTVGTPLFRMVQNYRKIFGHFADPSKN
jgi:hypothetical protein